MSVSDGVAIDEVESIEPVMIIDLVVEESVVLVPLFPDDDLSKDNMKINPK